MIIIQLVIYSVVTLPVSPSLSLFIQEATDNGLGSYNNVVNVNQKDFDAYFETWDIMSAEKGSSSTSMTPRPYHLLTLHTLTPSQEGPAPQDPIPN